MCIFLLVMRIYFELRDYVYIASVVCVMLS
jgi:hypothetical protein